MAVINLFIKELEREKEPYGEICMAFDARDGKRKVETRRRYLRQAGNRIGVRIYTAKIDNKIVVTNRKPKKDDIVA